MLLALPEVEEVPSILACLALSTLLDVILDAMMLACLKELAMTADFSAETDRPSLFLAN